MEAARPKCEKKVSNDNAQQKLVILSRQYRSIIRACLENLQEKVDKLSLNEEKRNSVPGILFFSQLLSWIRLHFHTHETTASQLLVQGVGAQSNPEYWKCIKGHLGQGRTDIVRALLKLHSSADSVRPSYGSGPGSSGPTFGGGSSLSGPGSSLHSSPSYGSHPGSSGPASSPHGSGTHYTGGFGGSPGVLGNQPQQGSSVGSGAGAYSGSGSGVGGAGVGGVGVGGVGSPYSPGAGGSGQKAPAGVGCMTGCTNGGKGTHYTGGFGGSPGVLGLQDKPGINVGAGGGAVSSAGSYSGSGSSPGHLGSGNLLTEVVQADRLMVELEVQADLEQ
ncbi:keratin, type I cytoskeletal 9-like [Ctenocephalides felis]|uniref:keratin, type I cytoskeletal 9-like n=1 Tax=Ctenocephalides felis TaxID=7515 RepID=UPI000E6E39A2|nr:keratin, type I cytoskeletal 9-like [Ctenocephalides felis]